MVVTASLIPELEDVIQNGTADRRAATVERIATLFLHGADQFNDEHVGLFDSVLSRLVTEIEAKGGKALMPAFDIPQGRIAMVADPQGNPFYVMKPIPPQDKPDAVSDVFSPTEEQRVAWNELTTGDPAAAEPIPEPLHLTG